MLERFSISALLELTKQRHQLDCLCCDDADEELLTVDVRHLQTYLSYHDFYSLHEGVHGLLREEP